MLSGQAEASLTITGIEPTAAASPSKIAPKNDRLFFVLPNYLTVENLDRFGPLCKDKVQALRENDVRAHHHFLRQRSLSDKLSVWGTNIMLNAVCNGAKEFWPDLRRTLRKSRAD